jgi:ferritin-like metal-binding protein YciE
MAKSPKKLDELFHDTLKDIYFAEKKILSTLPKRHGQRTAKN